MVLFKINGVQVIKSGTDFREFSCITVNFNTDNSFTVDVQRIEITRDIPEDPEVKSTVDKYVGEFNCFNFYQIRFSAWFSTGKYNTQMLLYTGSSLRLQRKHVFGFTLQKDAQASGKLTEDEFAHLV